ncbi:NADPH:quinone reductase [Arachidicoccus ginsenosidimutans]|uniref:quinone oxidoreductase family protein n=1 Tax=Arachidicoccus sp. BS20 TaxID=1850526 RepID=UPI0007F16F94|nr:zinc-binding dehydrogenase [Arachidicoccus sp. BS20]ANI90432.1 NADPH:quinone reductase [Arachidicoccus sp. BS20]
MKAAILKEIGTTPVCVDFPEPVVENEQQVLVSVKASSIKQLDLLKAAGKHYTKYSSLPIIVGMDGVASLENGQRIYAMGVTGMMAQKAVLQKDRWIVLPDALDDSTAAALPNFLVGSDIALRTKAQIKKGDIVLINGATGSTGMVAVQMAKYHNATTIIATGRNPEVLEKLKELGADIIISLNQSENDIMNDFKKAYAAFPFDIVIDYLWGKPMELLLQALLTQPSKTTTKIVTVGEMAGHTISSLTSDILRSRDIVLLGSGIGSFEQQVITDYMRKILPEIFQYAASGKLKIDTETFPLEEISIAWNLNKTVVIKI